MFAIPDIEREDRSDGSIVFRSREPLEAYPSSVAAMLRDWAARDSGHPLIAERDAEGDWQTLSYGEVRTRADAIGQALLDRGLGPDRHAASVAVLAEERPVLVDWLLAALIDRLYADPSHEAVIIASEAM
jgi:acyl-CoA synthetase (AMP-forming)/AMP-acid ligase II